MLQFVLYRTTSDIMRTPQFDAYALLPLFRRRQTVTMDEMKAALGTAIERTVFRKLQEFPYHSSYSHRGKFYTLDALWPPEPSCLNLAGLKLLVGLEQCPCCARAMRA